MKIKIAIEYLIYPLNSVYEATISLEKMQIIITRSNLSELMDAIKNHILIDQKLETEEMTAK